MAKKKKAKQPKGPHPHDLIYGIKKCPRSGKLRFTSEREALAYRGYYDRAGIKVTYVYQCRGCHDWHWTSEVVRNREKP